MSCLNPFISSSFYLTLSKPSLFSVNTPSISRYAVPPCLPQSFLPPLCSRTLPITQPSTNIRRNPPNVFVCLAVILICQKIPTTELRRHVLQLAVQRKGFFPHICNHRECDLPTRVCSSAWQRDSFDSFVVAELSELDCGARL